jgi:hypothetical protein
MAAIRRNYWTIQERWPIEIYKVLDRFTSENEKRNDETASDMY